MASRKNLSTGKAKKILKDAAVSGKPLTAKQKRFFRFISGGGKPTKTRKPIAVGSRRG